MIEILSKKCLMITEKKLQYANNLTFFCNASNEYVSVTEISLSVKLQLPDTFYFIFSGWLHHVKLDLLLLFKQPIISKHTQKGFCLIRKTFY